MKFFLKFPLNKHLIKGVVVGMILAWITSIFYAYKTIVNFNNTPGVLSKTSYRWPQQSKIFHDKTRDNLLVFVHPKCFCTESTLGELNRLLPHLNNKVAVTIIFEQPLGKSSSWLKGRNWDYAHSLPAVQIKIDLESYEFSTFKVFTSGQVLLFDKEGNRIFSGGLTPSRSHMGDSAGRSSILERIKTGKISTPETSVFGCRVKHSEKQNSYAYKS